MFHNKNNVNIDVLDESSRLKTGTMFPREAFSCLNRTRHRLWCRHHHHHHVHVVCVTCVMSANSVVQNDSQESSIVAFVSGPVPFPLLSSLPSSLSFFVSDKQYMIPDIPYIINEITQISRSLLPVLSSRGSSIWCGTRRGQMLLCV